MRAEHLNESDPIEELLLKAYPNPDRQGCPGRAVIEALGNLRTTQEDPNWYHIWHCSPCFAEFRTLRNARWSQEGALARRRRRSTLLAIAAILLIGISAAMVLTRPRMGRASGQIAQITIDLSEAETNRGIEQHPVTAPSLPRKVDEVHLVLPRFSEAGRYQIAILRERSSQAAVAVASAAAQGNASRRELRVRLDLSQAAPGKYFLGTHSMNEDAIYYYAIRIAKQ